MRHRGHPARRSGARGRRADAAPHGARHPPPRPRRLRHRVRRRRGPRLDAPRDLRHPVRLAAHAGRPPRHGDGLQRRGLQPLRAARRSSRPRASASARRATPRSCCACSTATARRRSTAATASGRIAHLDRPSRTLTLMRDRFGVRPLHYALLPDGGIVFSSEVKGILASGPRRGRARPRGHRRGLHVLGRAPAALRVQGHPPAAARPPARVARRRDRRGAPVVGAALRRRRARARARGARRAAARLGAAAPARRRAGRLLPLGRPRLEPDDRARRRADRPPAAHVLARLPRPALRRVRASSARSPRSSARSTT